MCVGPGLDVPNPWVEYSRSLIELVSSQDSGTKNYIFDETMSISFIWMLGSFGLVIVPPTQDRGMCRHLLFFLSCWDILVFLLRFEVSALLMSCPIALAAPFWLNSQWMQWMKPKRLVGMSFGIEQRRSHLGPILGCDNLVSEPGYKVS